MPTERLPMCKVREILRLTYDAGLASRELARRCSADKPRISSSMT